MGRIRAFPCYSSERGDLMRRSLLLTLAAVPGFLLGSMVSGSAQTREQTSVSGIVVDVRGSAVADARVQALIDRSIIQARTDACKFRLAVPKNRIAGSAIFATAPNCVGMLRAPWQGGAAAVANLRIQLVVSRPLEVSVGDEGGRPVAGAQVGALIDQFEMPFSETSAQGKVSLQLPVRAPRYLAIYADHPGRGLDYCVLELVCRHANARGWPADGRLSLKLSPLRRVTIREKRGGSARVWF